MHFRKFSQKFLQIAFFVQTRKNGMLGWLNFLKNMLKNPFLAIFLRDFLKMLELFKKLFEKFFGNFLKRCPPPKKILATPMA